MREIFYPKSVAVIGVSDKSDNLGRNIIAHLVDFGFAVVNFIKNFGIFFKKKS